MDNNYCIEKLGSPGRHQMKLEQRFLYDPEDCDPPEDESSETQDDCKGNMLVRELKGAALRRQEEAARTEEDFKKIIKKWDTIDENRKRKGRYNEILRGDVRIDYGCRYAADLKVYSKYMNTTA